MKHYSHLTSEQREYIANGLQRGHTQQAIAEVIGVSKSTVCREIKRNCLRGAYNPKTAQRKAKERRKGKSKPRFDSQDWELVERLLRERWSPEQISGRLALMGELSISHERIYQYVKEDRYCGGDLYRYLRCQKIRRKGYGRQDARGRIPNRVSIDQRPAIVDKRERIGDWELDTMYGKNFCSDAHCTAVIVTIVERMSRYLCIDIMPNRTAKVTSEILIRNLSPLKVLTLTSDNGSEFSDHQTVAKALGADFYFARPHASWQRGTSENTNGLIRQYFTRKHDFSTITTSQLRYVVHQLNNRPRKCLGMKTPYEVLFGVDPRVALTG